MRTVLRRLRCGGLAVLLAGPAPPAPAPTVSVPAPPAFVALRVGPIGTERMEVALVIAPRTVPRCEGRVVGRLTFFSAPSGAAVDAKLESGTGGCEIGVSVPYAALPPETLGSARADALDVRLTGEISQGLSWRPLDWSATVPRAAIGLTESMKVTLRRFVKVPDLHLDGVGLKETSVKADVGVLMPLAFDVRVLEARCDVEVNGKKVASGGREKFILHARRENRLEIPITIQNGAFVTAAGKSVAAGGKVEGKLSGLARVRLPSGEVDFPFDFPVRLSIR